MYPTLWGMLKESNWNTERYFRVATCILFDNTGEIYGIYTNGMQDVDIQLRDMELRSVMPIYQHLEDGDMVWPENLTGDLHCVVVPYTASTDEEAWNNSDMPKIWGEWDE